MVWDILLHIASLDVEWLAGMLVDNMLWAFMFLAAAHVFFDGKKTLRAFFHVSLAALFFASLLPFIGWQEYTGAFLSMYYVVELSVLRFAETIPFFAKRLIWVEEGVFFGSLVLFNVFIA